jgi:hypothetical protein
VIAFILAIASIIVAFLTAAHWNFGFMGIFLHPADYILFLAVPALISSRYGLKVTLRSLFRIDACSHEFRSTALLMTGYVSVIGIALGIVLTMGSLAAGPEAVGAMVARSIVSVVFGGLLSVWVLGLPHENKVKCDSVSSFAGLAVLGFGLTSSLLILFAVLWIVSTNSGSST